MKDEQKRLKEEYKRDRRETGVFQIRNDADGKVFLASALDLRGVMNRHRFELAAGSHKNPRLQADWNALGADNFAFEVLDQIAPLEGDEQSLRAELTFLEELWLERLRPFGERGYNDPPASREEKLRRIAERRRS